MSISFRSLIGEKLWPDLSEVRTGEAIRWRHAECLEGAATSSSIDRAEEGGLLTFAKCDRPDGRPVQQVDHRDVLITLSHRELYLIAVDVNSR